jgi:hypothetical protein
VNGAGKRAHRGRCEERKVVLRSVEDKEARGRGMPVTMELSRSAMAVACSGDLERWKTVL